MTNEQYEELYNLAMSPGGKLVANGIIKGGLYDYAEWLTTKIMYNLLEGSTNYHTWCNTQEKSIERIQFREGIYYKFYCKKEDVDINLSVLRWCPSLLYAGDNRVSFFKHRIGAKLGGVSELIWNENYGKAHKRLLSIIKACLIYSIYGKTN